jgi:hypothetical protein
MRTTSPPIRNQLIFIAAVAALALPATAMADNPQAPSETLVSAFPLANQ